MGILLREKCFLVMKGIQEGCQLSVREMLGQSKTSELPLRGSQSLKSHPLWRIPLADDA